MQYSVVLALAAATVVSAQGVTDIITPTGSTPPSCTGSVDGSFEITVVKPSVAKREVNAIEKRAACGGDGTLVLTLNDGVLLDAKARTGYIASNYQFQFDGPAQAGAIYTAGFSVCGNSSLALGPTTVFYQCRSGGFFNLYNEDWAPQCDAVAINIVPCGGAEEPSAAPPSPTPDVAPATTAAPVTQIADGQPQALSATPVYVSQYTDGQPQVIPSVAPSVAPSVVPSVVPDVVSQIPDGQPQSGNATSVAPTAPSVTPFAGAGSVFTVGSGFVAAAAGLVGVALL